jgi:hypothetical protein
MLPAMQPDRQLSLFGAGGFRPPAAADAPASSPSPPAAELDDDALIAAIPHASLGTCRTLTGEAARRRLTAAVPALAALCRRFKGFGAEKSVPEQVASLQAIAAIGGREASRTVAGLIAGDVIQGPGLAIAVEAARRLHASLPAAVGLKLLRHRDPAVRADAAFCVQITPDVVAVLLDLLDDLNAGVSRAAACALGRIGRAEARPLLTRLVAEHPSVDAIEAIVSVADDACIVLLGRIARGASDLAGTALAALEDIEDDRAVAIVSAIQRTRGDGQ